MIKFVCLCILSTLLGEYLNTCVYFFKEESLGKIEKCWEHLFRFSG